MKWLPMLNRFCRDQNPRKVFTNRTSSGSVTKGVVVSVVLVRHFDRIYTYFRNPGEWLRRDAVAPIRANRLYNGKGVPLRPSFGSGFP